MSKITSEPAESKRPGWIAVLTRLAEGVVFLSVGLVLFVALKGDHPVSSVIGEYLLEHGGSDTGALNLVTAIYLGFRAYDTLAETIVLLLAVSGVLFFLERDR